MGVRYKCELYNDSMQEWKYVVGYESLYLVSKKGDLFSVRRNRMMKQTTNDRGYKAVSLCKNGKRKVKEVHRIVAETFIENNICGYSEVNHIDGNKLNNKTENLEWVTKGENLKHAYRTLNRSTVGKKVMCFETKQIYASSVDAGRKTGINASAIRQVTCGVKKKAGGLRWVKV